MANDNDQISAWCKLYTEKISNFELPRFWFPNEKTFTTWFRNQIKALGGFFYKISDESRWMKPFDSIMAYKGFVAAVELKYTKNGSCYPFRMLSGSSPAKLWSQVKSLENRYKNGWNSIVIVYSAKKNRYIKPNTNSINKLNNSCNII